MVTKNVKIFIASSAEVKEEREECILHINQVNKSRPHLKLEAVEWEYDIPSGSYPNFETVQKFINPLLEESAFCVFIFHSKIGKYTREEFSLANELSKKLFAYFRNGFSPQNKAEIEKYSELIDFKSGLNDTLLYKEYQSPSKFGELLKDDLHLYLSQQFPAISPAENPRYSLEVNTLMKVLAEKLEEIEQLKGATLSISNQVSKDKLESLEQEKKQLLAELNANKEIQKQQAKERQDLESRLAPQIARDKLKEKALAAIAENKFDDAEELLKESAKDTISETASTFFELGKLKKIQLLYKEALNYFELAVKIQPQDFDINVESGVLMRDLGYYDVAIERFTNALNNFENRKNPNNSDIAYLQNELGLAYKNKAQYDVSIDYLEKALANYRDFHGEEHPDVAATYNNLGSAYIEQGKHDKAIELIEKAVSIDKKYYGEEVPAIAIHYNNLGLAYNRLGDFDKAIEYYTKAYGIHKKFQGDEHPNIATNFSNIGLAYQNKGDYDKAIDYYEKALVIDKKYHSGEHPDVASTINNLGLAYNRKGEFEKSISYFEEALAMDKKFHDEEHPNIAIRYNNIGLAYLNESRFTEAISYYEKALAIFEKFLPAGHEYILQTEEALESARNASKK